MPKLFSGGRRKASDNQSVSKEELYEQIGRLKAEVEWLITVCGVGSIREQLSSWIDPDHTRRSITRQWVLLGPSRTTCYHRPQDGTPEKLMGMCRIDELDTAHPSLGSRNLALALNVKRKPVQRLRRIMGIEGIAPKRRTMHPASGHKVFPYLMRNLSIERLWRTVEVRGGVPARIHRRPGGRGVAVLLMPILLRGKNSPISGLPDTDGGLCRQSLKPACRGRREEITPVRAHNWEGWYTNPHSTRGPLPTPSGCPALGIHPLGEPKIPQFPDAAQSTECIR